MPLTPALRDLILLVSTGPSTHPNHSKSLFGSQGGGNFETGSFYIPLAVLELAM